MFHMAAYEVDQCISIFGRTFYFLPEIKNFIL